MVRLVGEDDAEENSRNSLDTNFNIKDEVPTPSFIKTSKEVTLTFDPHKLVTDVALLADKTKMSHRSISQVLAVIIKSGGGDLDSFPINHRSVNRARDIKRQNMEKVYWRKVWRMSMLNIVMEKNHCLCLTYIGMAKSVKP